MFLVLIKGGIRRWHVAGHASVLLVINRLPVPSTAVFSENVKEQIAAAEFASRDAAEEAIASTLAYAAVQRALGMSGFDWTRDQYTIVEVPAE
jgi:hypothetical protein